MANPVHLEKLNEGVEAWNRQQATYPLAADFSGADLAGKDLSGADLRRANFENANLQAAKLGRGTMLRDANFRHANLSCADLSGADLQDAHFAEADLRDASLREANLLGAELDEVVGGLRTEQYAGADLTGAKLSEPLKKLYDSLENVKGISESARKIFLAVLAACLYSWLTIATTTDVNLITNRNSSPLPIIRTPIPIVGFYVVAPLLVLCVYFYFHFYLQKLWEELGSLPAVFPDGRPLHAKVDPWLLNDLVRAYLPKLNVDRPFLSYFQLWISVLLAWWIVPLTMLLFWGRYLRRHEWIGTTFHVVLLIISLVAAVCLYRLAVATLRGAERRPFTWKWSSLRGRLRRPTWKGSSCRSRLLAVLGVPIVLGAMLVPPSHFEVMALLLISYVFYWFVVAIVRLYQLAAAPLRGTDRKPFAWKAAPRSRRGYLTAGFAIIAEVLFGLVSWGARSGVRSGKPVFGIRPQSEFYWPAATGGLHTWVPRAMALLGDPPFANLDGAEVSQKKLTWSREKRKDLDSVNGAQLSGADLRYASAEGAFFADANLHRVDLTGADLTAADLNNADLGFANLTGARLSGADLSGANLIGADLSEEYLSGADLAGAQLDGTDLTYRDFRGVRNLDPKAVKRARNWVMAFYDDEMLKTLGLPPDHNYEIYNKRTEERKLQ
jgi:uncharacterized protein YjbI with pentapeptide repeats